MIYNNTQFLLNELEDNCLNISNLDYIKDDCNVLITNYNKDILKQLKRIRKAFNCVILLCEDNYNKENHFECLEYKHIYVVVNEDNDLYTILKNMKLFESFEVFKINYKKKEVKYDGITVKLTSKEIDILKYLYQNRNNVTTRKDILVDVLNYHPDGDARIIDVYVKYLRTKLGEHGKKIKTIRGQGYKFEI